jgi:hypothetical protein
MLCTICMNWAREASSDLSAHHPHCPRREPNLLAVLGALVTGIEKWAREEDGVPDWLWEAYRAAKALVAEGGAS